MTSIKQHKKSCNANKYHIYFIGDRMFGRFGCCTCWLIRSRK